MNKTIHFKNGDTAEITEEMFEFITSKMLDGCDDYLVIYKDSKPIMIINLAEVLYIR